MPYPPPPVRQFSFTDHNVRQLTAPPPGDRLDSEFDRTNQTVAKLVEHIDRTLSTDGTLRARTVGEAQLTPGLIDRVARNVIEDSLAEVNPRIDAANRAVDAVIGSRDAASDSADAAAQSAAAAQAAAGQAIDSAGVASQAAADALDYRDAASAAQSAAANADNHATGEAAASLDYSVLARAWAEHMPDTIPPNILAVMDITGDHWSSRWWAHKAAGAFGAMSELYLGVLPAPPTSTSTGEPIPLGAIYYNSTLHQMFVWDGTEWRPMGAPSKAWTISLVYQATAGQTVFTTSTPDLLGNSWVFDTADPEPVEVFANGVRMTQTSGPYTGDFSFNPAANTITFATGLNAGTLVTIDVLAAAGQLAPSAVTTQLLLDFNIDPATGNPGQIDGVKTTFFLALASDHSLVTVSTAVEIQVFVDGVTQHPGTDYNISGNTIIFGEAPLPGAQAWAIWFSKAVPTTRETEPVAPALPAMQQPDACVCPVGTLIYSVLSPALFAATLGDRAGDWVPTDGRDIAGTRLADLLGQDTAPTLRVSAHTWHYVRVN